MSVEDAAAPAARIEAAGSRAVAAERITNAYTGDVLPPDALHAPGRVTAARGTSNLPPAALCLGRAEELAWLVSVLTGRGEGARSAALYGLGGIGKSTLALHYAHRHRDTYSLVWWINAASPDEIETSLTGLTGRLVPGWAATAGREAQVAWAMQWLAWHDGWLLVHDNVEDPADLAPYTGALDRGRHLATSRRTAGWPDTTRTLALGTLDPDDAVDLLCRLVLQDAPRTPRRRADARALAADLGYFPLAVKQAGAYLAQNRGIGVDAYRRRLGTKLDKTAHGTDPERTIARIWNVTLRALEEAEPSAVEVLHTAAWLAPDDIPHTLLTPPDTDPDDIAEAIGTLAAYSMVTDTGTTVSIHRLVQTVLRTAGDGDRTAGDGDQAAGGGDGARPPRHLRARARAEAAVLRHLAPPPGRDTPAEEQWDTLTPHLVVLAATTPPGHRSALPGEVYAAAADRLHQKGHAFRAIPLLEAHLAQYEQTLGATHPLTLTARNNLAYAYGANGDVRRAIALDEVTLAQRVKVLGDTHPRTLVSRNNLARAYRSIGDLERAIPLYEVTLAQRERVLGETHADTLVSRNNLAYAYRSAGDLDRAIPLYEVTLAQSEQVLGDSHPGTLTARSNLASAYRAAGDLERAMPLHEAVLAQYEETAGATHPATLTARNTLASTYRSAGDLERAIPLLEGTLALRERVLGDSHPGTLISRNDLATAYCEAGDLERAVPLLEVTLALRERVLGADHPQTLTSRDNLARAQEAAEAAWQSPYATEAVGRPAPAAP